MDERSAGVGGAGGRLPPRDQARLQAVQTEPGGIGSEFCFFEKEETKDRTSLSTFRDGGAPWAQSGIPCNDAM